MIDPVKGYKPKKRRQLEPPVTRAELEKLILWTISFVVIAVILAVIWIW